MVHARPTCVVSSKYEYRVDEALCAALDRLEREVDPRFVLCGRCLWNLEEWGGRDRANAGPERNLT